VTELEVLVICPACGSQVAATRTCRECGAVLKLQAPVPQLVDDVEAPELPVLLTLTAADVLSGDEKALAYLCSLAVRAATGELSSSMQRELEIIQGDADADASLGEGVVNFARSISTGSPQWYVHLRRLRARLVSDIRVDLVSFAVATSNYEDLDIRTGPGLRRADAVLDALHSDESVEDWQVALDQLVMTMTPKSSAEGGTDWLPLARKLVPIISYGAALVGHPWVSLALDAAGAVMPTSVPSQLESPDSDIELARQLGLDAALMILCLESDPEKADELLNAVPELISYLRDGWPTSTNVLVEFIAALEQSGLPVPRRPMRMAGYSLGSAKRILDALGYEYEVKALETDGQRTGVWSDANWQVTGASFFTQRVGLDVRRVQ